MTTQIDALKLAFEALKENQHLVADNQRHAYVMEYNSIIEKCKEALAEPEQDPVAWEQFYPDIGKPQLKQLPQLSQEVVLQYPKEAVDWQKQQKEYAQQLFKETEQEPVAWYHAEDYKTHFTTNPSPDLIGKYWKPLYTTPPQPKEPEQEPVAWEQFYPDIGKPQLKQLPQLSQEVVLQYPKEAVDWQKQQKEYAQQLPKETEQEPATKEQIREAMIFNLPLYTTPPQRKPLTDEQVREIAKQYALDLAFPYDSQTTPEMFARAIEAAHNIKE